MPKIRGLLRLMAKQRAIEATGAWVVSYDGDHMTVALPRPAAPAIAAMEAEGYRVSHLRYFPFGSDSPADRLRHALLPGGDRSWWLYADVEAMPAN